MRVAVVLDDAKGLVGAKEPIRAAKRLDQTLILQDLVQVERTHPLGVKAREHLVHHDQQVEPLVGMALYADVGPLVGQPRRNVLLEPRVRGDGVVLARIKLGVTI